MSINEDEVDHSVTYPYVQVHPAMSKAEIRKSNKPIMEKRRRARINHSLNELKTLILDAMKKDPARHSKLEKADILEMTVKHLQGLQRHQISSAVSADPSVLAKFQTGFSECASEVTRYISRLEGVDGGVKQRLLAHLSGCVSGLNQIAPFACSALSEDVNNNKGTRAIAAMSGLQLSQLPSGELALLLTNPSDQQQVSTTSQPSGTRSAFTAVHPHSPLPSPSSSTSSLLEHNSANLATGGYEVTSTVTDEPAGFVHGQLFPLPPQPIHTPLTVLTSSKDPLDYSLKRPSSSEPLLIKSTKLPRTSESTAFTVVEPRVKPSTSSNEPSSSTTDMWRPW